MTYFLGVDQGSHSSRAVLFDNSGNVIDTASQGIDFSRREHGYVEYDAQLLLGSVKRVIYSLLSRLEPRQLKQVNACGIATQRSTVLAWDNTGNALSPALSWQDVRAQSLLQKLKPVESEIRRLTGLPLTPYYSAGKMHWLLQNDDSVINHDHAELRLSPLISYLLYHLLENKPYKIDYSNAQRTQLFGLDSLNWSPRLCELFDIDRKLLPRCTPMHARYGRLACGGIPLTAVCGDQNAAIFGSGEATHDIALVNIGSGAFILRPLVQFSHSTRQLTGIAYADLDHAAYMREATINGAGNALSWAEQNWGIENIADELPAWMMQVTDPPVFINTVGGLGTPWMQAGIAPGFVVDGDYSMAEKAVSIIESIVFMLQINLELMNAEAPLKRLRVSGGLSRLDGLCRKLSNLSGLELERSDVTEATARGVAWIAAGRPESWNIDAENADAAEVFSPQQDPPLQARYRVFSEEIRRRLDHMQIEDTD